MSNTKPPFIVYKSLKLRTETSIAFILILSPVKSRKRLLNHVFRNFIDRMA